MSLVEQAKKGVIGAIAAAMLFGASTPTAKALLPNVDPMLLAGLLYLGSGLGLAAYWGFFANACERPPCRCERLHG